MPISLIFLVLVGTIHFYIFIMESVLWGEAKTNRTFGISAEQAEQNRLFAFNQGSYNLFLALAAFIGVDLLFAHQRVAGKTLVIYSSISTMTRAPLLVWEKCMLHFLK